MRYLTVNESKTVSGGAYEDEAVIKKEKDVLNDGLESTEAIFEKIHDKVHHHTCRKECVISSFLKKH